MNRYKAKLLCEAIPCAVMGIWTGQKIKFMRILLIYQFNDNVKNLIRTINFQKNGCLSKLTQPYGLSDMFYNYRNF